MSIPSPADALMLGQHLVGVLDTGARIATYMPSTELLMACSMADNTDEMSFTGHAYYESRGRIVQLSTWRRDITKSLFGEVP